LELWSKDVASRQEWETFINSEAFKKGLSVLQSQATPYIRAGEPMESLAQRQAFQSGFHMCLYLLQNLPNAHYKKVQDELPEWDYIVPNENDG